MFLWISICTIIFTHFLEWHQSSFLVKSFHSVPLQRTPRTNRETNPGDNNVHLINAREYVCIHKPVERVSWIASGGEYVTAMRKYRLKNHLQGKLDCPSGKCVQRGEWGRYGVLWVLLGNTLTTAHFLDMMRRIIHSVVLYRHTIHESCVRPWIRKRGFIEVIVKGFNSITTVEWAANKGYFGLFDTSYDVQFYLSQ